MIVIASVRRQAADFEQLKPEGLDLGEHCVQRGLVRQRSRKHGVPTARLSPQGGERGAHRLAQAPAHTDLVVPWLRPAMCAGHVVTGQETGQLPTVVL
jgi:hypothetical protein